MREHMGLYKGKRIDNGEWVEGCLLVERYRNVEEFGDFEKCIISVTEDKSRPWHTALYDVDPDTVGECTGLRDKNGKLVFEGDILRFYEKEAEHEADGYCVIHFGRFKDTDALSDFDHLGWHITVTTIPNEATTVFALEEQGIAFEIIGNIHDNPELLKGGE